MIEVPTCLILGAGASMPYGLPSGRELRDLMVLDNSYPAREVALKYWFQRDFGDYSNPVELQEYKAQHNWLSHINGMFRAEFGKGGLGDFRKAFYDSRRPSIDAFIQDNEKEFGEVGKWVIAAVLLSLERENFLDGDWYERLLVELGRPEDLKEGQLAVITFNYDRSFERFFSGALKGQFGKRGEEMYSRIDVHHVYGSLGTLDEVPYGSTDSSVAASKNIELYRSTNHVADYEVTIKKINKVIQTHLNVLFMGFSFAPENMPLVRGFAPLARVYGTISGMSKVDSQRLSALRNDWKFENKTCLDFLRSVDVFSQSQFGADVVNGAPVTRREMTRIALRELGVFV